MNGILSLTEIDGKRPNILAIIMSSIYSPNNTLGRSMAGSAISVSGHIERERGSGSLSRLLSPAFAPLGIARLRKTGINTEEFFKNPFGGKVSLR